MTEQEIIEMAHKSGLHLATDVNWMPIIGLEYLEKFAKLVAEKATAELRSDVKINQKNLLQKLTRGQE